MAREGELKLGKISKIIRYNRWLRDARETKNFEHYEELVLKLHKLEIEDKVAIGSYIIKF